MNDFKKDSKGFTLIELITVIAIMAITSAIAIPSIMSVLPAWRVNGAARGIEGDMHLARINAISKNTKCRVRFGQPAANQYSLQIDGNRDGDYDDADDVIIRTTSLPAGIEFGATGVASGPESATPTADGITFDSNVVTFKSRGSANTGTVYLIPTSDKTIRTDRIRAVMVRFGATAFTKSYRYTGSAWEEL